MRDYEGLVKRLQDFAAGTMRDEDAQTAFDAIDAIVELQKCVEAEYQSGFADGQISANRKKSKWISVEERLPEEGKNVLVCICADGKYDITRGWYDKKQGFCCWDDAAMESADFTKYWMQMPEPPKEE